MLYFFLKNRGVVLFCSQRSALDAYISGGKSGKKRLRSPDIVKLHKFDSGESPSSEH